MRRSSLGFVLAIPVLLASGTFGSGGGATCDYSKPGLVFEKACLTDTCRAQVRKHLPICQSRLAGSLSKTIRHDHGVERAPYLSLAIMERLSNCISEAGSGAFDKSSLDFSRFHEVTKDVRGSKAERVGGECPDGRCAGVYVLPVVGQTTFLHGPV